MTRPPGSHRDRDRDAAGRARNARARDDLGRPLDRREAGAAGAPVGLDGPALPPPAALDRAQQLLDAGQPFAAHEVLEAVWKEAPATERELWRGLAQLAVGVTHARRGNAAGAAALLARAADSLTAFSASAPDRSPHGIDVDGLRAWAAATERDLAGAGSPPRLRQ